MKEFISELYNRLINKRITYKCVAYIDGKENVIISGKQMAENTSDNIVDAFEIKEFSLRRAYATAYEVLKLKYPSMGLDIRVFPK